MAYQVNYPPAHWRERRVVTYFMEVAWRLRGNVSDPRAANAHRFIEAYNGVCGPSDAERESLTKRAYAAVDYMIDNRGEFE